MQIKATKIYYHAHNGIATIKKQKIASVGKDVKKLEHLCSVRENIKWYSYWGK